MAAPKKKGKKIGGYLKLKVPAGGANPAPPVGSALGQKGLNIMDFCKGFNDRTKDMPKGVPCPVVITYYADKSFDFIIKTPPASYQIKEAAGIQKGSGAVGREQPVGKVKRSDLKKIAENKMKDLNANTLEAAISMLEGTARSIGIEVVEG